MTRRTFIRISAFTVAILAVVAIRSTRLLSPSPASASYPVIVSLVSRHGVITITAGPGTPLYTIADESGKVMLSHATMNDVRKVRPDLYEQISPTSTARATAWAGIDQ